MKALAKGLMGAAQGALKGAHAIWENNMTEARTERLLRARGLEAASLKEIEAEYDKIRDERDFEQEKVLKEKEILATNARAEATLESADRRAGDANATRIRAAEITASRPSGSGTPSKPQLFANKDTGEQRWITPGDEIPEGFFRAPTSGAPKDPDAEAFSTLRDRQRDRVTKMSPEEIAYELEARSIMSTGPGADKRALVDALTAEANEVYGLKRPESSRSSAAASAQQTTLTEPKVPAGAVPIGRTRDGRLVYRLSDGQQVTFD